MARRQSLEEEGIEFIYRHCLEREELRPSVFSTHREIKRFLELKATASKLVEKKPREKIVGDSP